MDQTLLERIRELEEVVKQQLNEIDQLKAEIEGLKNQLDWWSSQDYLRQDPNY